MTGRRVHAGALALLAVAGCRGSLSPLSNKLKIGQESYIVFVADGEDGKGDLFASPPEGGKAFQITFTRVGERAPALSPDGSILAFLRSRLPGDSLSQSLVVLNLLNGAERRTDAPPGAQAVVWTRDGSALLVRAGSDLFGTPAPPAELALKPVPQTLRPTSDSLFRVILGDPPLGEAGPCASGHGVCARLVSGDSLTLAGEGTMPVSWIGDSIAYVEEGAFVIRPLAGGRTRTIRWTGDYRNLRGLTLFAGTRAKSEK